MSIRTRVHRLLNVVALLGLLLSPVQSLAIAGPRAAVQAVPASTKGETSAPSSAQIFRTQVTVRTPADWARLEELGVVVLEERTADLRKDADNGSAQSALFRQSAVLLADADQLEALARLRFEPRSTDELGALVAAHAQAKPWLAAGLRSVLAEIAADHRAADQGSADGRSALPESAAVFLATLTSVDDDADGLTNTQEQ